MRIENPVNTTHETGICRNPLIHSSTGDREKLDRTSLDQHFSMLCFYNNIRTSNFWGGHNIFTEGLFVTAPSYCGILSSMNCASYDKLPFHERYVFCQGSGDISDQDVPSQVSPCKQRVQIYINRKKWNILPLYY